MRQVLVCPECGEQARLPVVVTGETLYYTHECPYCGAETPGHLLKQMWDFVLAIAHQTRGQGGGNLVTGSGGFPKVWDYYSTGSGGGPLMTSPGVFDPTLVANLAKFHLVTWNTTPALTLSAPGNLAIVQQLRALNPNIIILWYQVFEEYFQAIASTFYGDWWRIVAGLDTGVDPRFWYTNPNQANVWPGVFPSGNSWDPSVQSGWHTAANLLKTYFKGGDGYFFDFFKSTFTFPAGLDVARAGYANVGLLDAGVDTALGQFVDSAHSGSTMLIYGNRGMNLTTTATAAKLDGELFEGWDPNRAGNGAPQLASGYTFDQMMTTCLTRNGVGTNNGILLKAEDDGGNVYDSPRWRQLARYVSASAAIVGGMSYVGTQNSGELNPLKWTDEYWVTPSGVADGSATNPANRGWLGQPTEDGHKDASGAWVRRFQRGIAIANGAAGSTANVTLERPYKRILGSHDTTVNDGTTTTSVSVPVGDGRFLFNAA